MEESTRKPRRRYDDQFKRDAVRLITEGGRTMTEVGRDLGVSVTQLGRWREKFSGSTKGKAKTKSPEQIENEKLRRELARVEEEREILKKALAVFSRRRG
jgi:transposase